MNNEEFKKIFDRYIADDLNSNDPEVCKYDCLNKDTLDKDYCLFLKKNDQKKFKDNLKTLSGLKDVILSSDTYKQRLLLVIGNGFDLYHGLKTSYSDFRQYLKKRAKEKEVKQFISDFQSEFLPSGNSIRNDDLLWNNFENSLCLLKIAEVKQPISFDEFNKRITKVFNVQKESSKYLQQWLNDEIKNQIIKKKAPLSAIFSNYKSNLDDLFVLNFNYTDTFANYIDATYQKENTELFFNLNYFAIHGSAFRNSYYYLRQKNIEELMKQCGVGKNNPSSIDTHESYKLTLGANVGSSSLKKIIMCIFDNIRVSDKEKSVDKIIEKLYSGSFQLEFSKNTSTTQILKDVITNQDYLNFRKRILKNPTKIIIFGHSLDATDFARFYFIRDVLKQNELYISYYDESSIENIHKFLFAMGITDYSKVSIFCTKE